MKSFTLFFFLYLIFSIPSFSQNEWTKYGGNPVLDVGPPGSWDDENVLGSPVLLEGDSLRMWYSGYDGINWRTGHATSPDGITWAKDSSFVLDVGTPGEWDDVDVAIACILYYNSTYHAWYTGTGDRIFYRIGHATSPDGYTWTKDSVNNPVLDVGDPGRWDDVWADMPSVVYDGSTFEMWYRGYDGIRSRIGHATSPDGIIWTKDSLNNPVLDVGLPGSWDDFAVPGCDVLPDGTTYQMWYTGRNSTTYGIGYATSPDEVNWTKDPLNPVLTVGPPGSWDDAQIWLPSVVIDSYNVYHMWYTGSDGTTFRIGYAFDSTNAIPGGTAFFDNFDSYTAGLQLVCPPNGPNGWDTWTSNPCSGEDPFVSDLYAYSGANSVVIVENNDLVRLHGEQTSGIWYISFNIYIPSGQSGYFNTLSGFAPNPNQWAHEVYFDFGGAGRLMGVPGAPIAFTWLEDTWQQVIVMVNLDGGMSEFWFGTGPNVLTLINDWDWTQGGTVNNQLDATDFFGATALDQMYVDDYYVSDIPPPIIPVELTSFTASVNDNDVTLNWETATEINNSGFEVERKSNGEYKSLGFVPGFGTTTDPKAYTFTDSDVSAGSYTYRLKQIDYDGSFEYSDEIEVEVAAPLTFSLEQNYPNPFNPTTTINYQIPELSTVTIKVFDVLGSEITTLVSEEKLIGSYEVEWNASNVPSGVYFYQLKTKGYLETKKMILMK